MGFGSGTGSWDAFVGTVAGMAEGNWIINKNDNNYNNDHHHRYNKNEAK